MAVGDIERLVEGLVGRGLISPKMVGRTVGQATIDELQNLGRSVNESQMKLQREQESRMSAIRSQVAKQAQKGGLAKGGSGQTGQIKDVTKPFIVGHTQGSASQPAKLAIAMPTANGIKLTSRSYLPAGLSGQAPQQLDELMRMALENTGMGTNDPYSVSSMVQSGLSIPKINTEYHGMTGNYGSIQEIINEIAKQTTDTSAFKNIFGGR